MMRAWNSAEPVADHCVQADSLSRLRAMGPGSPARQLKAIGMDSHCSYEGERSDMANKCHLTVNTKITSAFTHKAMSVLFQLTRKAQRLSPLKSQPPSGTAQWDTLVPKE